MRPCLRCKRPARRSLCPACVREAEWVALMELDYEANRAEYERLGRAEEHQLPPEVLQ